MNAPPIYIRKIGLTSNRNSCHTYYRKDSPPHAVPVTHTAGKSERPDEDPGSTRAGYSGGGGEEGRRNRMR